MSSRLIEPLLFVAAAVFAVLGHGLPSTQRTGWQLQSKPSGHYRVVTWNVGTAEGSSGSSLDDGHLRHVAARLAVLNADLMVLQELSGPHQARALADLLEPQLGRKVRSAHAGAGRYVAVIEAGDSLLTERPRTSRGHSILGFSARTPAGHTIGGVAVHADAYSARQRNREVGAAKTLLDSMSEVAVKLLIGDLNLDLDLDQRHDLFTDDEHLDVETYNFVATSMVDVGLGTGATAEPDRRLDYIFLQSDICEVQSAGPFLDQRTGKMDHDPLVVDLRVRR